ncbi:MAG TPA: hypothetical protein VME46_18740 [Acidimicrobiales bacterium]|nr:hypothetical protein [Acidimicrobiales bacterium]
MDGSAPGTSKPVQYLPGATTAATSSPSSPRTICSPHTTIYWVNNSIATSMRCYPNANRYPWVPIHGRIPVVQAPDGLTFVT